MQKVWLAPTLCSVGALSLCRAGVRTLVSDHPAILVRVRCPLGHPALILAEGSRIRVHVGLDGFSSPPRGPRRGPAPHAAALRPRPPPCRGPGRPCCSGEGCRRPPRVARRRPNLRSSQRCRSCHRSFQPTSRRRPSRSSARRLRTRTRVGRRVASRHGASLHAGPSAPAASNPVDASQLCIVGCPCLAARPVPHSTRRASPGTSQHVKVTKSCLRLTRPEDARPPPAASSFAPLRGWRARGILNPAAPDHLSNQGSAP